MLKGVPGARVAVESRKRGGVGRPAEYAQIKSRRVASLVPRSREEVKCISKAQFQFSKRFKAQAHAIDRKYASTQVRAHEQRFDAREGVAQQIWPLKLPCTQHIVVHYTHSTAFSKFRTES